MGNAPNLKDMFAQKREPKNSPDQPLSALPDYAKPGPYRTTLTPSEEQEFQAWVQQNKFTEKNDKGIIVWSDIANSDYDMRGFWKAQKSGNPLAKRAQNLHFPDVWKTPYHKTFSAESMYSTRDAPRWQGNVLISKTGKIIADERSPSEKYAMQPLPGKGTPTTMVGSPRGVTQPGNIDLATNPGMHKSINIDTDSGVVVIPAIGDDGRIMSNAEAIAQFRRTHKHLGMFKDRKYAMEYQEILREHQLKMTPLPNN
jgi:hypothetical protein